MTMENQSSRSSKQATVIANSFRNASNADLKDVLFSGDTLATSTNKPTPGIVSSPRIFTKGATTNKCDSNIQTSPAPSEDYISANRLKEKQIPIGHVVVGRLDEMGRVMIDSSMMAKS